MTPGQKTTTEVAPSRIALAVKPMPLPRLRWLILILLSLSTTINYIDRQALSVLLPALRGNLHISSSDYGTITMLFLAAYTISQFFPGMLADKIGTRNGFAMSIARKDGDPFQLPFHQRGIGSPRRTGCGIDRGGGESSLAIQKSKNCQLDQFSIKTRTVNLFQ